MFTHLFSHDVYEKIKFLWIIYLPSLYEKSSCIQSAYTGVVNSIRNHQFVLDRWIRSLFRNGSSSASGGRMNFGSNNIILALLPFSMKINTWQCMISGKVSSLTYPMSFFFLSSAISSWVNSNLSQEKIIFSAIFDDSESYCALISILWLILSKTISLPVLI